MDIIKNKWYEKSQVEDYKQILSCVPLKLYLVDNNIVDGYFQDNKFFNAMHSDVTLWTEAWMIK